MKKGRRARNKKNKTKKREGWQREKNIFFIKFVELQ
jgi:hypothetical protein